MSLVEVLLRLVGLSMLGLAALHLAFAKRFGWRDDLAKLSLLNRQIFLVHCFFICLILVMMGLLAGIWPGLLIGGGPLARVVCWGICIFWSARLLVQWFGYSSKLWVGKRFETMMHFLFSLLWAAYAAVFGWVAWHA